jgi:maltooligosyltrehalose trehalohydrolase
LHRDLLALRREDPVLAAAGERDIDGAVLGPGAFALRYCGEPDDRLLVVNLERDLQLSPLPEPLVAPPLGSRWTVRWHSESPRYGGSGLPEIAPEAEWRLPAHCAVLFASEPCAEHGPSTTS